MDIFIEQISRLERIIAGLGLTPAQGQDVLQDVYLKTRNRLKEFSDQAEATRWLTRVAINRALLEYRNQGRFQKVISRIPATKNNQISPDIQAAQAEEEAIITESLQELDETLMVPLTLRYFSDLDASEIGKILDLTPSTVRTRLRQARLILAKKLIARGIEP